MQNLSAGLLMCKHQLDDLLFFLVHPGGPFYKNKNDGVWSIPKGIPHGGEDLLTAAQREFKEETGLTAVPPFHPLQPIKQKAGKIVHAWAFLGEWDSSKGITCNTFKLEWPPRSGAFKDFPEQDRAGWFTYDQAKIHINPAQVSLLDQATKIFCPTVQK